MKLSQKSLDKLVSNWMTNKSIDRRKYRNELSGKIVKRLQELSMSRMCEENKVLYERLESHGNQRNNILRVSAFSEFRRYTIEPALRGGILKVSDGAKDLYLNLQNNISSYFGECRSSWYITNLCYSFPFSERIVLPITEEELLDYLKDPILNKLVSESLELLMRCVAKLIELVNYIKFPGITESFIKKHNKEIYEYFKEVTSK